MKFWFAAILGLPVSVTGAEASEEVERPPSLVVRLIRPDEQARRVIGLFRESRSPHPAAALAAWKNATGGDLGKPLEGLIAAFNPGMARELNCLDDARFSLRLADETKGPEWRLILPNDDGSLAAASVAIGLTDGQVETSIGTIPVLRLGPSGAPFAAIRPRGTVVASDLSQLRAGLDRPEKEAGAPRDEPSGWDVQFQPASLRGLSRMDARRVMAGLEALGCDRATCRVGLENDALAMRLTIHLEAPAAEVPALDPAWLQPIPAFDLVGVVSFALASKGETVGTLFAMLDRIEKADPARAGVAPLRTRLNLLAASAKVFPDTDLWPHLRGVSVALSAGPDGKLSGLLVLQTNDPEAAERIASKVVPRLASRLFGRNPAESVLQAKVRGSVVIVGWGRGAIEASLDTLEHPERSVAATIRGRWGKAMPQRAGAFWPGRLPGILPADSPFAVALREASPVVWAGRIQGKAHQDEVRWGGLDRVVKRWLEGLPLKPPTVD